jgi:hypothetical protein
MQLNGRLITGADPRVMWSAAHVGGVSGRVTIPGVSLPTRGNPSCSGRVASTEASVGWSLPHSVDVAARPSGPGIGSKSSLTLSAPLRFIASD